MTYHSNMTSKGQVTVPKDIRDALGLLPGHEVEFELDELGGARILKADDLRTQDKKQAEFANRLREVRKKFKPMADFNGMDGLAYQRWLRGEGPEV